MSVIARDAVAKPSQVGPLPTSEVPNPDLPPVWFDRLYRMNLDEYHRLAEFGVLDDTRVELIEGLLLAKMSKNQPHIIAMALLLELVPRILPPGWFLGAQDPVTLPESGSEPEPDFKIVRGRPRDYKGRRIGPGDTALAVELAESSLRDDRGIKKSIYAKSGIPIYWIVNLVASRLEIYSDPVGSEYRTFVDLGPGDQVPIVLDGVEVARIAVDDILP